MNPLHNGILWSHKQSQCSDVEQSINCSMLFKQFLGVGVIDSTANSVFAMHTANPGSIPGNQYGSQSLPWVISQHKARCNSPSAAGSGPKTNKNFN